MAACGMVILAGFLLGGCGSVESGIVRTTAAVEGYQNPDAKESCAAENVWKEQESEKNGTDGGKPHVVLQQKETEASEEETEAAADPCAALKGSGSDGGRQDLREGDGGAGKNADRLCR